MSYRIVPSKDELIAALGLSDQLSHEDIIKKIKEIKQDNTNLENSYLHAVALHDALSMQVAFLKQALEESQYDVEEARTVATAFSQRYLELVEKIMGMPVAELVKQGLTHENFIAKVEEMQTEISTDNAIIETRNKILEAIPECKMHGNQCVPHALQWVELQKNNAQLMRRALADLITTTSEDYQTIFELRAAISIAENSNQVYTDFPYRK